MTTDDTVTAKLAQWAALTEAATEGPWSVYKTRGGTYVTRLDLLAVAREWSLVWQEPDAEFIAASRTALPALLGLVEDVQAALAHEPCADTCGSQLNEVYPCSCWKSEIEQALTKRIGGVQSTDQEETP